MGAKKTVTLIGKTHSMTEYHRD